MFEDKLANFVETENIAYFTALLEKETCPEKRELLTRLLADERAKRATRLANAQQSISHRATGDQRSPGTVGVFR